MRRREPFPLDGTESSGAAPKPAPEPDSATDADLWEAVKGGDEFAFGQLFERHAEAVWNHAYRLTASWSLAEDLTAGAFLIACRKRKSITLVRASALPWLYAVVGNLARTEYRSGRRFARALVRIATRDYQVDHAERVVDRIDGDRTLRRVLGAIARLPRGEREVVQMCLLGELSTTEAAAALGVAEPSVRSRISRARSKLRTVTSQEVS